MAGGDPSSESVLALSIGAEVPVLPADWRWQRLVAFLTSDVSVRGGVELELTSIERLRMHPLLAPAAGKLSWAHRQLGVLEESITHITTDPTNRAAIRAELDQTTGYHGFTVSALPDLGHFSEDFTNAVADIAKNLHPALDQFAWQLACAYSATGSPPDPTGVTFPITDDSHKWASCGRARAQIAADHWEFMEEFQPFRGSGVWADNWQSAYVHPLALLRDISVDDKHRITRPIFLMPGQIQLVKMDFARRPMPGLPFDTEDMDPIGIGQPLHVGLEVMRARFAPDAPSEINPAGAINPIVSLGDGRHAIPTLQRIERFVHLVFSEFARRFP